MDPRRAHVVGSACALLLAACGVGAPAPDAGDGATGLDAADVTVATAADPSHPTGAHGEAEEPLEEAAPLAAEIVPPLEVADLAAPLGEAPGACRERLAALGVSFRRAPANPGIEDPVMVYSPVNGVRFHWSTLEGREYPMRMDCRLALALHALTAELRDVWRVRDLAHYGTYLYRCIRGSDPCRLSHHAQGLAIDIAALRDDAGAVFSLRDDWVRHRGPTCPVHAETATDQTLKDVACWMYSSRTFSAVLTPNYNTAHENHFHVQVAPTSFGAFELRPHVIDPPWVPRRPEHQPGDDEEIDAETIEALARAAAAECALGESCYESAPDAPGEPAEDAEPPAAEQAPAAPVASGARAAAPAPVRETAGGDRLELCTVRRRLVPGDSLAPRE